jgi:hypothetical protein
VSAQDPATLVEWYKNLPLPWLVSGANGQAEGGTWPQLADDQIALIKAGIKARFPDYAPTDALPRIGGDRQLIQGSTETDANFITRLKTAWDDWARAGTPLEMLVQLYWLGFSGAVWVQQNGLAYTLSGAPTAGVDPTSLLVASNTSATTTTLTSTAAPYRTIPAGTPWFDFDGNTDMCNRFAIILPSWPFAAITQVYFNNSDSAVATWPVPFSTAVYSVIYGVPSDAVILSVDGTTQTTTSVTLRSSAPWTGSVWVIGFASGVSPFTTFGTTQLGILKKVIQTWRPNAQCMGVFAITSGELWDYPTGLTWDGDVNLWDSSTSSQILGAF